MVLLAAVTCPRCKTSDGSSVAMLFCAENVARRSGSLTISEEGCNNSGLATRARSLRARSARLLVMALAPAPGDAFSFAGFVGVANALDAGEASGLHVADV